MDSASITAIAALAGSVVGGLTLFTATWISQSGQARIQQLASDKACRQELSMMFIEEASKLYLRLSASKTAPPTAAWPLLDLADLVGQRVEPAVLPV